MAVGVDVVCCNGEMMDEADAALLRGEEVAAFVCAVWYSGDESADDG